MLVYHIRGLLWQLVLVGALPFTRVAPFVNQICDLLNLAYSSTSIRLIVPMPRTSHGENAKTLQTIIRYSFAPYAWRARLRFCAIHCHPGRFANNIRALADDFTNQNDFLSPTQFAPDGPRSTTAAVSRPKRLSNWQKMVSIRPCLDRLDNRGATRPSCFKNVWWQVFISSSKSNFRMGSQATISFGLGSIRKMFLRHPDRTYHFVARPLNPAI